MSRPPTPSERPTWVRIIGVVITAVVFVAGNFAFDRDASLGTIIRHTIFAIVLGVIVGWELPTRLYVWYQARRATHRAP